MEIRQLEHLVAVIEQGSIKRACSVAHISQPGLSMSLKRLEEAVGAELLTRHARGVKPTPAGEAMYQHAKVALRRLTWAEQEAQAAAKQRQLVIGIGGMFRTRSVLKAIADAQAKSGVRMKLVCGSSAEALMAELVRGDIDMGLARLEPERLEGLEYTPLYDRRLSVYCASDHPLAINPSVEMMVSSPWVMLEDLPPDLQQRFDEAFRLLGVKPPTIDLQVESLGLMLLAILAGYVGALPDVIAADACHDGHMTKLLLGPAPPMPSGAMHRSEDSDLEALQILLASLKAEHPAGTRPG